MIQVDPNKRLDSEAVYALAVQQVGSSFSTPGTADYAAFEVAAGHAGVAMDE